MKQPLVIFDARGTILHSIFRGVSKEPVLDSLGNKINPASHGIETWLDTYMKTALELTSPMNVVAVWDGGADFRKSLFPEYKAKRHAKEKEPVAEMQYKLASDAAKRIIAYSGGINVHCNTVEADDLIALICQKVTDRPILLFTRDADLLQLAENPNIQVNQCEVWRTSFKCEKTETEHEFKYVRIYKALCGDSSDEYPGVPGFGPAAFNKFIEKYGYDGLEELEEWLKANNQQALEQAVKETGCKLLDRINSHWGSARLCLRLSTLHPQLCWGFAGKRQIKPNFYVRVPSIQRLQMALESVKCGWKYETLFARFMPTYALVTADNVDDCILFMEEKLPETEFVAFDHEGYDSLKHPGFNDAMPKNSKGSYLDVLSQKLTGTSFCFGDNNQYTFYFSFGHKDTNNLPSEYSKAVCEGALSEGCELIAHNANFEEQLLKQELDWILPKVWDTRIMASYFDENLEDGLKDLTKDIYHYEQVTYAQLMEMHSAVDMRDLTGEQVLAYGCDDSFCTAYLAKLFWFVMTLEGSWDFYTKHSVRPTHLINRAFEAGTAIDYDELAIQKARDDKLVTEEMIVIRDLLTQHCVNTNEKAANYFFQVQKDYYEVDLRTGKGKTKLNTAQIRARLEEKRLTLIEKSAYLPFSEVTTAVPFLPTALQLTALANKLGITVPIESVATSRVSKWVAEVTEILSEGPALPTANRFVELMAEAAHELKNRVGLSFDLLMEFCNAHNPNPPKVETVGDELNLGSSQQMQHLLYCKLGLPVRVHSKKTKESKRAQHALDGGPGTNEEAIMMAIAEDCPEGDWRRDFLRRLLAVKAAMTREELYWHPYPNWKHPRDGVIHPSLKLNGTVTRRPTGGKPNVLAVDKGETRKIYIPRYAHRQLMCAIDFNGQELRLTGSEAKDPVMIDCYTSGGTYLDEDGMLRTRVKDIHSVTGTGFAHRILSRDMDKGLLAELPIIDGVMDYDFFRGAAKGDEALLERFGDKKKLLAKMIGDIRKDSKVVNFLLIYGGTAFTLAQKLGVPERFAQELMDLVFSRYPRLGPWQEETIGFGERFGYTLTAYGNRRHLDENVRSSNRSDRNRQGRQGVNSTIQGTAADILHIVLTLMEETRLFQETKSNLLAPVYDEIASSVDVDHLFEYCERAQDIMNLTPPGHPISMLAEVSIGKNWGELTELGDRPSQRKIEALIEKEFRRAA